MRSISSRQAGFTLLEVLVVLVIIGIIGGLVVPNLIGRPDEARMTVAKTDIRAIGNALELYKLDNHTYPSTDQGLEALVTRPSGAPEARNWSAEGYLKKLPVDPWGNPYQYIAPGTNAAFDIYSFGADGKDGGEGVNADITSGDL